MATTTTNFGWDIPQSTDLVKDGATAIAALGQDIDTAFVDFKGGTTGQVLKKTSGTDLDVEWGSATSGLTLINTTSFSAVAIQSINDFFSATYDNYRIIINSNNSTTSAQSNYLRMRVGGADNSSANYRWSGLYIFDNSATPTVSGQASNGLGTSFYSGGSSSTAGFTPVTVLDLSNPFATKHTSYVSSNYSYDQFGTRGGYDSQGGVMSVTTSYTGFTIVSGGGNITGTVSVFGYSKSNLRWH